MDFLEVVQVSKSYASHVALNNVSLNIPHRAIFGMLGPNGAGKTTLIRIINQITKPDKGTIYINGDQMRPDHAEKIGYMPEERGLYRKMKVGELLLYLGRLKGLTTGNAKEKIEFWLNKLEIADWWYRPIEDLSKGMQQKVQFIVTVIHDPELIILDEPFSGFDPINTNIIRNEILRLRNEGKTVILSTHRMESVEEMCSHVALINRAEKVLEGKKDAIKEKYKNNVFNVRCRGNLNGLERDFLLLEKTELGNGLLELRIQNADNVSANELLKALVNKVEIESFQEEIPNMHDIFVKEVSSSPGK